jgi:hypothetical protein
VRPPSLHLVPVDAAAPLPLPPHEARRPWTGTGSATGGGLAVGISLDSGLREVLRGTTQLALPDDFAGAPGLPEGAGVPPSSIPFLGPGGWCRPLAGGGQERGALLEPFAVVAVQRLGPEGAPDGAPDDAPEAPRPVLSTHLLVPDDVAADTRRRLARSLSAWVLRRQGRGSDDAGLAMEGAPALVHLAPALVTLEDAPLRDPVDEEPEDRPGYRPGGPGRGPVVLSGTSDDGLLLLSSPQRLDVALGALAGGRWTLARRILEAMLHEGADLREEAQGSPAARLFLATRWALWTGEVERLRRFGKGLDRDARALAAFPAAHRGRGTTVDRGADLPAAFPSSGALLGGLADAVEPLGDRDWVRALREMAQELAAGAEAPPPTPDGEADPPRPSRGLPLPVIGASPPPPASTLPGPRPEAAQLPPVEVFASPFHPAVAARRTVHAARLVRSAVEDLLGVRPDASYGRVTLAPDLRRIPAGETGVRHLTARGLRVGDVRIDLDCRITGTGGTLRVSQVAGRVPVNVIFEPRLPLSQVRGVEFAGNEGAGEPVNVDIHELDEGVRLRFQFPLDPERRVTVDGTA